jgi:hypothetical protein
MFTNILDIFARVIRDVSDLKVTVARKKSYYVMSHWTPLSL